MGTQAAFVSAAFAGAAYLQTPKGKATKDQVLRTIKSKTNPSSYKAAQSFVQDLLKRTSQGGV